MSKTFWKRGFKRTELEAAQNELRIQLPPDLLDFLLDRRPSDGHNWNDHEAMRQALNWPLEGLLFDVEHNELWWPEWGIKPEDPDARKEILSAVVSRAPTLIPVYSHRYIPEFPNEKGNPIFSVHQSDIIHYGADLDDYLLREFEAQIKNPWPDQLKEISFWSEMVRRN